MPDGIVELAAGSARARLAPGLGGRITALSLAPDGEGMAREVLAPFPEDVTLEALFRWPKGGLYPLVPYGNRVRGARLLFGGVEHALPTHPDAAPHTLHGPAHRAAWRLSRHDDTSAAMDLDHGGGGEWPWRFVARLEVALSPGALSLALTLRNTGDVSMPAGIGLHPYLRHDPDDRVGFRASTDWPVTPDGLAGPPVPATDAFDPPRTLPPGERASYRSGWDGRCAVLRCDSTALRLRADAVLDHLVLYRPAGAAYLCLEPCSHAPDGFNLSERGVPGAGRAVLAPGEVLSGRVEIALSLRPKHESLPNQDGRP